MNKYIIIALLLIIIIFFVIYNKRKIQKIPKIILQTWKNDDIPSKYSKDIESLKRLNPDYEYKFFTDNQIDEFLSKNYPQYYETYKKLPKKIQKIDFFRYVAIYHYGGFYFDLDITGLKKLDDLIYNECIFPVDTNILFFMKNNPRYKKFYDNGQKFLVGQYAFGACKNNEFLKLLIDTIKEEVNNYDLSKKDTLQFVYDTTGPDFVSNIYSKYPKKDNIKILHKNINQYFGDYAVHNCFGTWKESNLKDKKN